MSLTNLILLGIFTLMLLILKELVNILSSIRELVSSSDLLKDIGDGLYSAGNLRPPHDPNFILSEDEIKKMVKFPFRNEI